MYQFPMYFPHGFDLNQARELGYLVEQAYAELDHSAGAPTISTDPPAALGISARDYTDVVPLYGTIRLQPRLWNWLVRFLRLPHWLVPARSVVEPFGFVARRGECVFLVFRGTRTRADWWEDLHMEQLPVPEKMLPKGSAADWSGAAVESGVLLLYLTIREAVLGAIRRHAPPLRVYVTGHSLGACLARLAVPDLIANTAFNGAFKPIVYDFGEPRFVNSKFARASVGEGCHSFRIVHTDDIVPSLMPAVPVLWFADSRHHLFYAHAGVPVDFTVTQDAAVPDRQRLIVANHEMTTYAGALWQDERPR
jgi:hypothetical protein